MAIINGTAEDDFLVSSNDGDVLYGLEGNDTLYAFHNNVTLYGGAGADMLISGDADTTTPDGTTMDGGSGADYLIGIGTNDTASYANDEAGVVVDLSSSAATDGTGSADILVGIENVTGSAFADSLTGDDLANVLQGGEGNDTLAGGEGNDIFKYSFDLTPGGGGGGVTSSFTEFFAAHGGKVVNGEVADGTKQGQFSSLYTQWLESLGLTVVDLGQNSGPGGMPVVEGPEGTFGERENFTWTSGGGKKTVTHERWYSDTWTSKAGGGQDTVASNDGFDTIVDFTWGVDQLEFNGLAGLTLDQFASFFNVTELDLNGDDILDTTTFSLSDNSWGVTLLGVSGRSEADFYSTSVFS